MQRASFRSRPAPSGRFNEGSNRPSLVLIRGGKARTVQDESKDLLHLLLRILFPWDFNSREEAVEEKIETPVSDDAVTGIHLIVSNEALDEIIAQNPVRTQTLDQEYAALTRRALEPPRAVEAKIALLKVHPRALGQFVRFFYETAESTRAYINRKLKQRYGADAVKLMDYHVLAQNRRIERERLIAYLSELVAKHGKRSREDDEWRIRIEREHHSPRVFFAEFDSRTGEILKFLLEKDRGRRKAFKSARRRCYRRGKT